MCSNCKGSICGGRGAIAYQNSSCGYGCGQVNNDHDCGCGNDDYVNNGCSNNGCVSNGCSNNCGCNGIIGSLAKGFACTTNRIVRGLDRSLSSCGGYNNGCGNNGCNNNGCGC
ncbi:MAG: hypothetical protein E7648_02875 [Ruminococcaceae bacterium]|nr:hypothetical protein [Oscillospiraceae bacterium]